MEILGVVIPILLIIGLGAMFWMLWGIHRSLRGIEQSLDQIETSLIVLSDQLTILLYIDIKKNHPELLEKSPDLLTRALEAAERLGRKQLPKEIEQRSEAER